MICLFEKLAREGNLICPSCEGGKLQAGLTIYLCCSCGKNWPVHNHVPIFLDNTWNLGCPLSMSKDLTPDEPISEYLVQKVISVLDLADYEHVDKKIIEILRRSTQFSCHDAALCAEVYDIIDRFSGVDNTMLIPEPPHDANMGVNVAYQRHYMPDEMTAGQSFSANVRLRNTGQKAWSSRVLHPLMMMTTWLNQPTPFALHPFPIDIQPGCAISLPLRLKAPVQPGEATLRLCLAWSDGTPATDDVFDVPIFLKKDRWLSQCFSLRRNEVEIGPHIDGYEEDHANGVAMIEDHLKKLPRTGCRALEIGSGTHPHLAWLDYLDLVALDISSPLLELGSLYFRNRFKERLGFVCADAMLPPFRKASFDMIVMFSALHHFPEPEALLKKMSSLVAPNGFIAVMCEPVGDTLETSETLRDLWKGINEQVFSVREYRQIFKQAHLDEVKIKLDGGSLKAILRPSKDRDQT